MRRWTSEEARSQADCFCLLHVDAAGRAGWDEREQNTAGHVEEAGWSVVRVGAAGETPDWAYSIGMWHTLRSPEVAVFGLPAETMHAMLNTIGEQARGGQPLVPDDPRADVLDGLDVVLRPIHSSWYPDLFGAAIDFYTKPPLPFAQVFWPDPAGRFPWDAEFDAELEGAQPLLWLPWEEHPEGAWREVRNRLRWRFGHSGPDTLVFVSKRIMDGETEVVGIVHDHEDSWQFLDGGSVEVEDIALVHLQHVVDGHPEVRDFADLPMGHQAWLQDKGTWARSSLPLDEEA